MAVAEGIRDGSVTAAFRRWEAPRVKVGSTQLTPAGVVEFVAVDEVSDPTALTDADAHAAGLPDADALQRRLAPGAVVRSCSDSRVEQSPLKVAIATAQGVSPIRLAVRATVSFPATLGH